MVGHMTSQLCCLAIFMPYFAGIVERLPCAMPSYLSNIVPVCFILCGLQINLGETLSVVLVLKFIFVK